MSDDPLESMPAPTGTYPEVKPQYALAIIGRSLALIPEVDQFQFLTVDRKLATVKKECDADDKYIRQVTWDISVLTAGFAAEVPQVLEELREAQNTLDEILGIEVPKPPPKDEEESAKYHEALNKKFDERFDEQRAAVTKEARKVFREIALRCHPEKTKDPALHELFDQAKVAKETNNVALLKELHKEMVAYRKFGRFRKDRLQLMRHQLKHLSKVKQNLKDKIEDIKQSDAFLIYETHETNPFLARKLYRNVLDNNIATLRMHIAEARSRMKVQAETNVQAMAHGLSMKNASYSFKHQQTQTAPPPVQPTVADLEWEDTDINNDLDD